MPGLWEIIGWGGIVIVVIWLWIKVIKIGRDLRRRK